MSHPRRFQRTPLAAALGVALLPLMSTPVHAQLEEVVVTATKQAESLQDVPISVNALSGDSMREQGIMTFDEYVDFLPNVVDAGNAPGMREIYIRGSATEQGSVTVSSAQGSAPGVALYLDETPVSFGGRNLDVYAADLERIEVLSGPQGTLFGASSQAGNMRMITNKPAMGEMQGRIDIGMSSTQGGDTSSNLEGMINIPIGENLAVRAVGYNNRQGGWIDNASATFTPSTTVLDRNRLGFGSKNSNFPQTTYESATNTEEAKDDWNEATYTGYRVGVKWDVSENWSALVQHSSQKLDVEGSFLIDPSLGSDKSAKYAPESNVDEFDLTTLTLEGRIAGLDIVYAGGYLERDIESLIDYTHYNNGGGYITYYLCGGDAFGAADPSTAPNPCFDPSKTYADATSNERTTHELRISTDPDRRWRVMAGVYFSDVETKTLGEFQYASSGDAFSEFNAIKYGLTDAYQLANETMPGVAGTNQVGPTGPGTTFYNDYTRTEEELAFFGQIAFDITDNLTATLGARKYDLETQLQGASNFSFGCRYQGNGGGGAAEGFCNSHTYSNSPTDRFLALGAYNNGNMTDEEFLALRNYADGTLGMFRGGGDNASTLAAIKDGTLDISSISSSGVTEEDDTIIRFSLDWRINDDIMVYGVYSEGYRPAAQNRNAGQFANNQGGIYEGYVVPAVAKTDELENMELGIKSELFGNRLRLNASVYSTEITDLQVARFDPSNVAFLVFLENIGDAETRGLDVDFMWAVTGRLTLSGAASILDTELTKINSQLQGVAVPKGSELPLAPSFSGNLRARYDFDFMNGNAWANAALVYRGETVSGIVGSAEFMTDTHNLVYANDANVSIQEEGGTFGTVNTSAGSLPSNSRYVNDAATTLNLGLGYGRNNWTAEIFVNNVTSEEGYVVQPAGKFTPESSMMRPRTMGLRFGYSF
jgi:outer membrane receptor protein involved in Fe transport